MPPGSDRGEVDARAECVLRTFGYYESSSCCVPEQEGAQGVYDGTGDAGLSERGASRCFSPLLPAQYPNSPPTPRQSPVPKAANNPG